MKKLIDYIIEALSNTQIFEMAYDRRDYLYRIMGLNKQIVENWCLVKYCNMFDEENYNRLHWSNELISHLDNLYDCKLKKGLNKYKTTEYGLIENAELDDEDVVKDLLYRKWKTEKLPDNTKNVVAKEFVKALPKICELVSGKNKADIDEYVYNEI